MARAILLSAVALGFDGVAADGSQCPLFEAEAFDTDLSGSDLGQKNSTATSDECCALCEAQDGCQGFVFLDQICYLKGAFSGTYSKAGVVSRLRSNLGSGCPGYEPAQQGKDLAGTLIEDWSAPNSEVCCAACASKAECQGFAFDGARCYLKGAVQGMYDNEGVMVRVKEGVLGGGSDDSQPQCPEFEAPLTDTDMSGTLIASAESATVDGCCAMCDANDLCDGFVFFEERCYLKAGFSGTFPETGRITRIKANLAAGCSGFEASQQDKDLSGELLQDWAASGPGACCTACSLMQECQGFAFSAGHCYLKGNVVGTYDHTGVVTRVKTGVLTGETGAPPQCSTAFEGEMADTDVAGELLAASPGETVDACCPMCEAMAGCQGFAHFEGVCYLKGKFSGTFSKVGVVSRLRGDLGEGCPGFAQEQAEPNTDLAGVLLESWAATLPEACCAACAHKEMCQGFAFVGDRCYLKGEVNGTYEHESCATNVKTGVLDSIRRMSVLV